MTRQRHDGRNEYRIQHTSSVGCLVCSSLTNMGELVMYKALSTRWLSLSIGEISGARAFTLYHTTTGEHCQQTKGVVNLFSDRSM